MDANQMRRLLQSTTASTLVLMSSGIVMAEHLVQFEPDRPQVSAAYSPIWGYNRPCWRRFPEVPPCDHDGCPIGHGYTGPAASQAIYVPQPQQGAVTVWSSEGQQMPVVNKPMNILPGNMNAGSLNAGSQLPTPMPSGAAPAGVIPPHPGTAPIQPMIPQADRPLPPLPSPPASTPPMTPVPDPGAQQSRYAPSPIWTPRNTAQTSRYGQIPTTTISNRVIKSGTGSIRQLPPLRRTP